MHNKLLTALLALITAGAASAQVTGSSSGDTNALQSNPAAAQVVAAFGNLTNTLQSGPAIDQSGSVGLAPMIDEPLSPGLKPWLSDQMAVDEAESRSFVDPDQIRLEGEAFSQELDLLRAATRGEPVYFGRDKDIKFVEHHEYQPGIPVPVGMSYRMQPQRLEFFAEIAPILDSAASTALGWGGGVGIRFYIGR